VADTLTHEAFAKHLGTKFEIQVESDKAIELELTEVSELEQSERQEQFAIVFRSPNEVFLGQGIQRMEHEQLGQFEIFIVPISRDDKGDRYEAVFNRVHRQAQPTG
jgi:hypothetical protein